MEAVDCTDPDTVTCVSRSSVSLRVLLQARPSLPHRAVVVESGSP